MAEEHFTEYVPEEEEEEEEEEPEEGSEQPASPRSPPGGGERAYEAPAVEAGGVDAVESAVDLLKLDDFLTGDGSAAPAPATPTLELSQHATCTPQTFQGKWGSLGGGSLLQIQVPAPPSVDALKQSLQRAHFKELASGVANNELKLYIFAQVAAVTLSLTQSSLFVGFQPSLCV